MTSAYTIALVMTADRWRHPVRCTETVEKHLLVGFQPVYIDLFAGNGR